MREKLLRSLGGVLCAALLCTSIFTGCSNNKEKKERQTAAPTSTPMESPEDQSSNLGAWTRAMGSVLIELNEGNPYIFGGYEKTEDNKAGAVKILQSSWNINSKKALLQQIQNLLKSGDRAAYQVEAKDMAAMPKNKLKTAMKQLSGDLLIHYQLVQYHWKTWEKKGLLAWDMCRISHLAQWGYIADYLTLEEAQAVMEPAIMKIKENFTSWDEVQNNWLDGYCLFAGIDREAANTDYTVRKALYEELKSEQNEKAPLYDDNLFQQSLTVLPNISYKTVMRENLSSPKPTEPTKSKKKAKSTPKPER